MNGKTIKTQANNRRGFLKSAAALITYGALRTPSSFAADIAARRKIRTGVQLWSVRKLCDKDFPGTLKALKDMGYEGVQCGGFYGCNAKELRTLFSDTGLAAAGMQMQASQIIKLENLAASVDFAKELGAPYLFVPWFDAKTADGWKRFGEQMATAADAFKTAGIRLGYHNHQHEFRDKFDGVCKWEFLFKNTSTALCQQLDIGHCKLAGEDPARWINKYPGRIPAVHVKAASKTSGAIGGKSDAVDWNAAFKACEANTTEWYVVEAEIKPDSLDDVRSSIQFMKKQGRA